MAQMLDKGIDLLFLQKSTRMFSGQQYAPASIYHRKRTGTHFRDEWVGVSAGLEGRKICPHLDSIPDFPGLGRLVAIPTELLRSTLIVNIAIYFPYNAVCAQCHQLQATSQLKLTVTNC